MSPSGAPASMAGPVTAMFTSVTIVGTPVCTVSVMVAGFVVRSIAMSTCAEK